MNPKTEEQKAEEALDAMREQEIRQYLHELYVPPRVAFIGRKDVHKEAKVVKEEEK
jgi:hypothetical protein